MSQIITTRGKNLIPMGHNTIIIIIMYKHTGCYIKHTTNIFIYKLKKKKIDNNNLNSKVWSRMGFIPMSSFHITTLGTVEKTNFFINHSRF